MSDNLPVYSISEHMEGRGVGLLCLIMLSNKAQTAHAESLYQVSLSTT